jgi:hypothetical protein
LPSHVASPIAGENESDAEQNTDNLDVVTYNVDAGSRLAPLLAAPSPQDLPAATSQVWAEVQASRIPERAVALARQIAWDTPDVVGLQDVATWTVNGVPRVDFLRQIQQSLRARGQHYVVVARDPVNVFQLPDAAGEQIGYIDQTVILANSAVGGRGFRMVHSTGGTFPSAREVQIGGAQGPVLTLPGAWALIDFVNSQEPDHAFRFLTARLDSADPAVNAAQGSELLAGPANVNLPVVMGGDFGGLTVGLRAYQQIGLAGYRDAWLRKHAAQAGFTSAEPDLRAPGLALQTRSDQVFIKQGWDMADVNAFLLGTEPSDRTRTGLWPSDHAGLLARLLLT